MKMEGTVLDELEDEEEMAEERGAGEGEGVDEVEEDERNDGEEEGGCLRKMDGSFLILRDLPPDGEPEDAPFVAVEVA